MTATYWYLLFYLHLIYNIAMAFGALVTGLPTTGNPRPHNMYRKRQLIVPAQRVFTAEQEGDR